MTKNKPFSLITFVLLYIMLSASLQLKAQYHDFIGSRVTLSVGLNDSISPVTNETAVCSLNDENNTFTATVSLFPVVDNPDIEDSLAMENNLLQLTFTGEFPIDDFSFYVDKNDQNQYSMNGKLSANGITNPYTFPFTVRTSRREDPNIQTLSTSGEENSYPALISFAIQINPADFDLDVEPIALKHEVTIEIIDGIINKLY